MKKIFWGLLLTIVIIVSYIVFKNGSFSPLKTEDFQRLFIGRNVSFRKLCSKDFVGISAHGELFEIYRYQIKGASINKYFPNITEWENTLVTNATVVGKWRNCPIDSQATALYESSMLKANNLDNVQCFSSFKRNIMNPNNFYSYVYFSESEEYFMLYCSDKQELYYIRLRL